jgi:hypothetical protein
MPTLYRGKHFVIHHHSATGYVHFVRTEAVFASHIEIVNAVRECERALSEVNASASGILLDWRRSPMSTDANLHSVVVKHCDALAAPFRRRAVILATPVGRMQAQRIIRTHSDIRHEIFGDMDAAITYVTGK